MGSSCGRRSRKNTMEGKKGRTVGASTKKKAKGAYNWGSSWDGGKKTTIKRQREKETSRSGKNITKTVNQ